MAIPVASVRTGRAEQGYQSNDLVSGTRVSDESKTHYVGSHICAGKVRALSDSLGLGTYAHYIWQRQGSDSVQMSSGETLAFDAVTSQHVRLGARLAKSLSTTISAYVGAGYENELEGKAQATTNGIPIESPTMKGASGVVEVGLNVRPIKNKALLVGMGLQGYFGQKEGGPVACRSAISSKEMQMAASRGHLQDFSDQISGLAAKSPLPRHTPIHIRLQ